MTSPRARLAPLDVGSLAYAAYALTVIAVRWPSPPAHAWPLVVPHVALGAVALAAPRLRRAGAVGAFVAEFYALAATLGLYTSIGLLNRAAGLAHDARLIAWEQALCRAQPAYDWIRAQPWAWLSAPLHAAYFSYYFILAGTPLALWVSGRRAAARDTLGRMMAAFYACYAIFLVFPVAGPHYAFPLPVAGKDVLPARVVEFLIARGDAWGTAFPSSHVAVALVAAGGAWRGWRALGAFVVPLALLLAVATVYGQFHYVLDALAGALVAAAVLSLGRQRDGAAGRV